MKRYAEMFDRAEQAAVPLSALVELTHACNVDCEHCYLDLVPDKKIGALSTGEWKRIFDELAAAGCLYLTFSGGELLTRRDWYELGCHARDRAFALRLFTNGVLIDEGVADRMAALRPLGVEVSLHGATAETQDAITRRAGSFARALDGIRLLRERAVPVLLKCVIMRRNVGEYARLRELGAELGADVHFDAEVTPKNNGCRDPVGLALDDPQLEGVARDLWGCAQSRHFDRAAKLADAPCSAGRRSCQIGPTGDLFPCVAWPEPMGNLRTASFDELWNGPGMARIRAKRTGDLHGCRDCEILEACTPCMALSLLENGDLAGPSPTKCRTAVARAGARNIAGRPAGSLTPRRTEALVQLRLPKAP